MSKIGVRAHDYGRQSIESLCAAIARDGWETIQLAFPKAVQDVDSFAGVTPELLERTATALKESGLSVAVLGVYVEPSLADETARAAQAKTLRESLPGASLLGAGCVGTETTAMRNQPGVTREDALCALRRTLEEVLPEAERLGVTLALEPVFYHTIETPERMRNLLRQMRSPCLKVIFDPVNLLRPEDIHVQRDLWKRCAEAFGEDIAAIHIKGASAAHRDGVLRSAPLEDSVVDYAALADALRGADVPILRELAIPAHAASDIRFIRTILPCLRT